MRSTFKNVIDELKADLGFGQRSGSILHSGFQVLNSDSIATQVRISNLYALILSVCALIVGLVLLALKITVLGVLTLPIGIGMISVIVANSFGWNTLARLTLIGNLDLAVYLFSTSLGRESAVHLGFITAAMVSFAIFNLSERRSLFGSIGVSCGLLVFEWLTNFQLHLLPIYPMDDFTTKIVSLLMMAISMSLGLSVLFYVVFENKKNLNQIINQISALNASAIVAHTDRFGRITYVNDTFCKISGYTREELVGKTHSMVNSGFHPDVFFEDLWNTIKSKKIWHGEILNKSKNGEPYWVDTTILPIVDVHNQIQGYTAIRHDITATKQSELKFRSVFDHGVTGLVFIDVAGKIIDCNDRYAVLYGRPKAELLGKKSEDLSPNQELESESNEVKKLISGDCDFFISERKIVRPDDSTIWCSLHASRIKDFSGATVYYAAILQDISQTKRLQMTLANASTMAALGQMSAGVAHEINNPLAIIQGSASQLIRGLQSGKIDSEVAIQKLQKIISTTERIAKIVYALRTFAKDTEHDPFLPIKIKHLIANVLSLCSEKFRSHGIKLEVGAIPLIIFDCREAQLEQVLLSIINNGFEAVSELENKWVRIDINGVGEEKIQISITDSGNGVSPAIAAKMMHPFYTTKEIGKGTGLGLSVAKGIVENHQGTLYYDASSPNTRFVVEIPIKQKNRGSVAA